MKKWISGFLALVLLIGMIPAGAYAAEDDFSLSSEEIERICALSGLETSVYHKGMTFSDSMTAYQMYCWLIDFNDTSVAEIENQCVMFTREMEEHPEWEEIEIFGRIYEMHEDADYIQQAINYFTFELDAQMQAISASAMTAVDAVAAQDARAAACRRLIGAEEKLNALILEIIAYQPHLTQDTGTMFEELSEMHAEQEKLRKQSSPLLFKRGAGRTAQAPDFRFSILSTNQLGFSVTDKKGYAISGAAVCVKKGNTVIQGKTEEDGSVKLNAGVFGLDADNSLEAAVCIEAVGYQTFESQGMRLSGGETWHVELETDTGSDYVQYMTFRGVDILHDTETIYYSNLNEVTQSFEVGIWVQKGNACQFVVEYTDAKTYELKSVVTEISGNQPGLNVIHVDKKWCSMIAPDTPVNIYLYAVSGGVRSYGLYRFEDRILVEKGLVSKPTKVLPSTLSGEIGRGGTGLNGISIPTGLPVCDSINISFSIPKEIFSMIPVNAIVKPDGTYGLSVGFSLGKKYTDSSTDNWEVENSKQSQKEFMDFLSGRETLQSMTREGIQKRGKDATLGKLAKQKVVVNVTAILSGRVDPVSVRKRNDSLYDSKMDLFVGLTVEGSCAWQEPFMAGPVPVFVGASFSAGAMFGFDVAWNFETSDPIIFNFLAWRNFSLAEDEFEVFLTPRAGFTFMAGVGVKNIAAIYLKGTFAFGWAIRWRPGEEDEDARVRWTVDISAGLNLIAEFLWFNVRTTIVSGKWHVDSYEEAKKREIEEEEQTRRLTASKAVLGGASSEQMDADSNPYGEEIRYTRIRPTQINGSGIIPGEMKVVEGEQGFYGFCMNKDHPYYGVNDWLLYTPLYLYGNEGIRMSPVEGLGKGVWGSSIPADAYVYDYDVASTYPVKKDSGNYSCICLAVLFARHSEDIQKGKPGKLYCEFDYIYTYSNGTVGRYQKAVDVSGLTPCTSGVLLTPFYDAEHSSTAQYYPDSRYYFMASWFDADTKAVSYAGQGIRYHISGGREAFTALDSPLKGILRYDLVNENAGGIIKGSVEYLGESVAEADVLFRETDSEDSQNKFAVYLVSGDGAVLNGRNNRAITGCIADYQRITRTGRTVFAFLTEDEISGRYDVSVSQISGDASENPDFASVQLDAPVDIDVKVDPANLHMVDMGASTALHYLEISTGNGSDGTQYDIKSIYLTDGPEGKLFATKPFHLGEFSPDDLDVEKGLTSFEMVNRSDGRVIGFIVESPDTDNSIVKHFTVQQSMQIDIRGAAVENPMVKPGETINLMFNVMNTGNTPVSRFTLHTYIVKDGGDRLPLSDIFVSCTEPQESMVMLYDEDGYMDDGAEGEYAVSQYDYFLEDDMDSWTLSDGDGTATYATGILMPEESHSYRATFRVPEHFDSGDYGVYIEPASISTVALRSSNGSYDSSSAWAKTLTNLDEKKPAARLLTARKSDSDDELVTITSTIDRAPKKNLLFAAGASGDMVPVAVTVEGEQNRRNLLSAGGKAANALDTYVNEIPDDSEEIDLDCADLNITAKSVYAPDGDSVHIVFQNDTATPIDHLVLSAFVDGVKTYAHAFDAGDALDYMDVCSLDLPQTLLTGGRKGQELTLMIDGRGNDITEYNNTATLPLQDLLSIAVEPEDVFAAAGGPASFSVLAVGGTQPYAYQWQTSDGRDGSWKDITGANGSTLAASAVPETRNGSYYRCIVTDASGQRVISRSALLVVSPVPDTGDHSGLPLVFATGVFSLVLMIALLRKKRRVC